MQMMKKRTNCYIYTRVSTSMQVDGYSLDAQREKLRGYAAYQEMTIVGEYSDEGFSGKNIQGRMEFRRMLEDIQAQKRNGIITYNADKGIKQPCKCNCVILKEVSALNECISLCRQS